MPFAGGHFPTPSGKVELYSSILAEEGLDPLPGWVDHDDDGYSGGETAANAFRAGTSLSLITGAAHHFVTSSLANQPGLLRREGEPFVEIHPQDAAARDIQSRRYGCRGKRPWVVRIARRDHRSSASGRSGFPKRTVEQTERRAQCQLDDAGYIRRYGRAEHISQQSCLAA